MLLDKISFLSKVRNYKYFLFDSDGVIFDSNIQKLRAFEAIAEKTITSSISYRQYCDYLKENSHESRYDKIDRLLSFNASINSDSVYFNDLRLRLLSNVSLLIQKNMTLATCVDCLDSLKSHLPLSRWFVVSSSDELELKNLYETRKISKFFLDILGSPKTKKENISFLIEKLSFEPSEAIFFGDACSDLKAASYFNIDFAFISDWSFDQKKFNTYCNQYQKNRIYKFNNLSEVASILNNGY